jgi:hypothetical protein
MAEWTKVDGSKPLQLLFQVDFEDGFEAQGPAGAGVTAELAGKMGPPTLGKGIKGKAAQFASGQSLSYGAAGHLNRTR